MQLDNADIATINVYIDAKAHAHIAEYYSKKLTRVNVPRIQLLTIPKKLRHIDKVN